MSVPENPAIPDPAVNQLHETRAEVIRHALSGHASMSLVTPDPARGAALQRARPEAGAKGGKRCQPFR